MSKSQEANPTELVGIYRRAHEELAQLEGRLPSPLDESHHAIEVRAAIERHRIMIREIRRALSDSAGAGQQPYDGG